MIEETKKQLNRELEDLKKQLAIYKSEDPLADPNQSSSRTVDDEVTVSEGHDRVVATRLELKSRLAEVSKALRKIDDGKYGICENCGKKISKERLNALPTASLCFECRSKNQ